MDYEETIKHFAPAFQAWGNTEPDDTGYRELDPDNYFLGKQTGMAHVISEKFNKEFFDVWDDLTNA